MKAMIPAAGYATRMYPLTKDKPKALLPIAGKPIIEYIVDKILELGCVDQIYIVTNDKFTHNFEEWARNFDCEIPIKIVNDHTKSNEDRLGSIGDKSLVMEQEKIDDEIIDIASDNLFNFSLKEMYGYFKKRNAITISLYDVKEESEAKKLGIASINGNDIVTDFEEKPNVPKSTLASIGIYIYPKGTRKLFRQYLDEGNSPDHAGSFIEWLYKRNKVYGFKFDREGEHWFDIGSLEKYKEADEMYTKGQE